MLPLTPCSNWYWLVDGLMEHGYPMRLVHTSAVPQYDGIKHGNDHTDARHLVHLLRLGILPEGYIYPREGRALRDLLRRRFQLVHQSTALMHAVQCAWSRRTGHGLSANGFRQLTGKAICTAIVDPIERLAMLAQIKVWRALDAQVQQVEKWVSEHLQGSAKLQSVRSTPGIGIILGSTIVLESGDIARFASVGD